MDLDVKFEVARTSSTVKLHIFLKSTSKFFFIFVIIVTIIWKHCALKSILATGTPIFLTKLNYHVAIHG